MNRKQLNPCAFVAGAVVPIEALPDPALADRESRSVEVVEAPARASCEGSIRHFRATRHAYVIETGGSTRLKRGAFAMQMALSDRVRVGQPGVGFDPAVPLQHGKPSISVLVIESGNAHPITLRASSGRTAAGDPLPRLAVAGAPKKTREPVWHTRIGSNAPAAMPSAQPEIKPLVRRLNLVDCHRRTAARSAMHLSSSVAVRSHARNIWCWRDSVA
jgi:phosphotransferase system IIA component